jgi:hypothetical protein
LFPLERLKRAWPVKRDRQEGFEGGDAAKEKEHVFKESLVYHSRDHLIFMRLPDTWFRSTQKLC